MIENAQVEKEMDDNKLVVKLTIGGRQITEKEASLKSSANILLNFDSGLRLIKTILTGPFFFPM